jgi:hypothetical protein
MMIDKPQKVALHFDDWHKLSQIESNTSATGWVGIAIMVLLGAIIKQMDTIIKLLEGMQ